MKLFSVHEGKFDVTLGLTYLLSLTAHLVYFYPAPWLDLVCGVKLLAILLYYYCKYSVRKESYYSRSQMCV